MRNALKISGLVSLLLVLLCKDARCASPKPGRSPGPVFVMGWNGDSQLGVTTSSNTAPLPLPVALPISDTTGSSILVVDVAAGDAHSILVSSEGNIYSVGRNNLGQLGHGDFSTRFTFQMVLSIRENQQFVTTCSAGASFSACTTDSGEVLAFGDNTYGQLGTGDNYLRTVPNTANLSNWLVTNVYCGLQHVLAITSNAKLLAWGDNQYGQLGFGNNVYQPNPTQVTALDAYAIVQAQAGDYHSVALTDGGQVFAWGHNAKGQLGSWNTTTLYLPNLVRKQQGGVLFVTSIAAGAYHTMMATDSGDVWCWGTNTDGQLGIGVVDYNPHPIPSLVASSDLQSNAGVTVYAGAYHCVAVTADSRVFSWGWNRWNQLGTNASDVAVPFPQQINFTISPDQVIVVASVGTGYAHSIFATQTGDYFTCGPDRYGFYVCGAGVEVLPTLSTDTDTVQATTIVTANDSHSVRVPPIR